MVRPPATDPRQNTVSVRLTASERLEMEQVATALGFPSLSEYLRHLHNLNVTKSRPSSTQRPIGPLQLYHSTDLGTIYNGNSLDWLLDPTREKSVDLIITSPPFGLVRKKSYGNEDAEEYCQWFQPFAQGFRQVLKNTGSLVIDVGGAWKPGLPVRSLYHFELLLMLCKEYGFHLCLEHYWWNPAKLPTPAEWVNLRRVRVKDAVNCIWWLSLTPYPKANNRRVLAPYSDSMQKLLKNGYQPKTRPSGHVISRKFGKDNGGSVPPNILAIANTESTSHYQKYCRDNGLEIHPARFPALLPEYFIRLLTERGDFVLDPFAGSCVTGMVAESLGRRWTCIELNTGYLEGGRARFQGNVATLARTKPSSYWISTPCAVPVDDEAIPLIADGGQKR